MALVLNCDEKTLSNRFSQAIKEGRAQGKSSLKRKQYELAMKGDRTMLIWLGKILCGQIDTNRQYIDQTTLAIATKPVESSEVKKIMEDLHAMIDTKINERKG